MPILPAPEMSPPLDEPEPISQSHPDGFSYGLDFSSPVALALSAVLALVPCAEDTDPGSAEAVLFRRNCAQFFAQAAIESIEAESEIPGSSTEPEKTLESEPPSVDRLPFHPRVPVELESIIALNLLSVYEYAQRGNLKRMSRRAGQALMEAMMTYNLHNQTDDDDFYAEAKRRVWWMTVCVCRWGGGGCGLRVAGSCFVFGLANRRNIVHVCDADIHCQLHGKKGFLACWLGRRTTG